MTLRTESRNRIGSNPHAVWAFVCEVGRWPEWAPTVHECWIGGGASFQPGSRVEQRANLVLGLAIQAAVKPSTRGCVEL
jgi:hypothetical protein